MWQALSTWLTALTVDDFNKVVLAVVALVALFLGPWMQWRIAKRQVQMQAETAKLQIETQSRIATRQIADNISTKRQNWIDELRKDAAEFLTVVGRIQELKRPRIEVSVRESPSSAYWCVGLFQLRWFHVNRPPSRVGPSPYWSANLLVLGRLRCINRRCSFLLVHGLILRFTWG